MVNNYCKECGAPLGDGVKLCPRCGKVAADNNVPQGRRVKPSVRQYTDGRRATRSRTSNEYGSRQTPRKVAVRRTAQPRAEREVRPDTDYRKRTPSKKRRIAAAVFRALTVAVLIAVIYFLILFIQVTRVKMSSYDFDSEMNMSYSNYGQAMSSYFDEGSWSYNPFTFKCTYTGTSRHDEEYEIVFTVKFKTEVTKMTIDGDEYTGSAIESRLMAMFI